MILAFYPADWSPVCGDQMALYNELIGEFKKHGASLLGISVDGAWCHGAFAAARKLHLLFEHQQDDLDALDDAHVANYAGPVPSSASASKPGVVSSTAIRAFSDGYL